MKILNISKSLLMMLTLSAMTVACDEGNDTEYDGPGAPTASDCPQAFFSEDNETDILLNTDDNLELEITVNRVNSKDAVDVPIIVESAHECFNIPESVHFNAGEKSAIVKITFPDIPTAVEHNLSLKLDADYTNRYAMNQAWNYDAKVVVSRWLKIVKDAEFFGYNKNDVCNIYQYTDIYWLEGQNRFRVANFLESGIDVTFEIDNKNFDAADPTTWAGYVYPLDHFAYYSGNEKRWNLVDDEGNVKIWTTSYGYTTKANNWFSIASSSYGWEIDFVNDIYGDEDGCYHGFFRMANASDTFIYMWWEESSFNTGGF